MHLSSLCDYCHCCRTVFSTNPLQIHTIHSLDQGLRFHFLPLGGQQCLSVVCAIHPLVFKLFFSKFTWNIHWTMVLIPVHFHYQKVTFVTTRGQISFFLFTLYRTEFSTDLLWIQTKYSLDQNLDSNVFWSLISYICGHYGANLIFSCVHSSEQSFQWIVLKFTPNILWTKI